MEKLVIGCLVSGLFPLHAEQIEEIRNPHHLKKGDSPISTSIPFVFTIKGYLHSTKTLTAMNSLKII